MAALAQAPMKLVYFNARGVAEISRSMLAMNGVDFEDQRFPISFGADGSFSYPEFTDAKEKGELVVNMDRGPVLCVGDVKIGQSKSIERYLARRFNMLGADEFEAAQIDCLAEHVRDIKEVYSKISAVKDTADKDAQMAKWFETGFAEWLTKLEKSLPSNRSADSIYAVGSKLSLADMCIWNLLHDHFDNTTGVAASVKNCPLLIKIAGSVDALPALQAWLTVRPKTAF